jgi:hypothetical protein
MDPSRHQEKPGPVELAERISNSLIGLFVTLYSANSDISLYCLQHTVDKISQDPSAWKKMDEAYSMYEEQSNRCRRLWMKLRAASENETSQANGAGTSSVHGIRPSERSHSPLKYQSEIYDEDEPRVDQREDDTPTIVEIVTPSGPTSSQLAQIPKSTKLSVETTRIPAPSQNSISSLQVISVLPSQILWTQSITSTMACRGDLRPPRTWHHCPLGMIMYDFFLPSRSAYEFPTLP